MWGSVLAMALTGKKVLVTGGAGFVGSNLCRSLISEGNTVIAVDNYFAGSKDTRCEGVDYREGHTKDIEDIVPETDIDLIYHLGEYSRVEQSLEEPQVVWDLNVVGTAAVVEYWRKRKCKLVYAGSSTKFADAGLARNATPYAFSKAQNTELVKNYAQWYGLPFAITYFYNVYGPGERSGRYGTVIAIFAEQVRNGQPVTVTSPGTQERNFTHVSDIINGLLLVGEKGEGDEFGLGNEKSFSILEVARLFSEDVVMMPPRPGNRLTSAIDISKSRALGWEPVHNLEDEIHEIVRQIPKTSMQKKERRVLVFTTTFHPIQGVAEEALCDLMAAMPDVHFDVVTTKYHPHTETAVCPVPNASIYRVGYGRSSDKFLLPILGYRTARELHAKHRYLFAWALMASYASLAALMLRRASNIPLLVTLADQNLDSVPWYSRLLLKSILRRADQVYGSNYRQEKTASILSERVRMRSSMGEGDAFANQLRFVYHQCLRNKLAQ